MPRHLPSQAARQKGVSNQTKVYSIHLHLLLDIFHFSDVAYQIIEYFYIYQSKMNFRRPVKKGAFSVSRKVLETLAVEDQ